MSEHDLSSAAEARRGSTPSSHRIRRVLQLLCFSGSLLVLLIAPALARADDWKDPDWIMDPIKAKTYFKTDYYKAKGLFRSQSPTPDQIKQIKQVVQYHLSLLTHDESSALPKLTDKLMQELNPALCSPAVRQILFDEIIARATDLMAHPKSIVRFNALATVFQLNVKPGRFEGSTEIPPAPYNPAYKFLIQVLKDQKQFLDSRILAAKGLGRILRDGDGTPSSTEKSDIGQAIVETLAATPVSNEDGVWWFRNKMIEALGFVDRIDNSTTAPIMIEALLDVVVNRSEKPVNRALAAQSLTQLPFSSSTNVPLITEEIMKLLYDLSGIVTKAPTTPGIHESFVRVYLSFRPATVKQAKDKKWGLLYQTERTGLSTHAAFVKSAWDVAFPILKPYVSFEGPTPVPSADKIKALGEWLKKNPVANRRVVPGGKEYPASTTT